jgi:hypothetical protein
MLKLEWKLNLCMVQKAGLKTLPNANGANILSIQAILTGKNINLANFHINTYLRVVLFRAPTTFTELTQLW